MMDVSASLGRNRGIAFVGNYLPRKCGIATFTHDLAEAVAVQAGPGQPVIVAAMDDVPEGYDYPDRVRFEVRQDYPIDYARAADFLSFSRIDVVSLQHEFGIFGGTAGANVLALMKDVHRPIVVTCHTVLKEPDQEYREVFSEIAARASRLVVMSEKALAFLDEIYRVPSDKVACIPHGIHDVPFIDPSYYKDKFGLEGRRVLLTFGLLHRNKGIEHMIEALPGIVARHPRTTYLILGATHPAIVREEGESYRLSLQRRVRDLGLEENVLFHPRFVDLDELLEYIGASDIFVTPYLNLDQITSGALSYAMGAGKAVVSTPYWHAEELLAEGRGRLVPIGDSKALAREIGALLDDEVLLGATRKRAYLHCRSMTWAAVARSYLDLFDEVRSRAPLTVPLATAVKRPFTATNLPMPKLDQLLRLSDDTGLAHHAYRKIPEWRHGYWLSDAACGLVVGAKHHDIFGDPEAARLAERCLELIQYLVGDGSEPAERADYDRRRRGRASAAHMGMVLWALGYGVSHGPDSLAGASADLFDALAVESEIVDPRGAGYAVLGTANYLSRFCGASAIRRHLAREAETVAEACSVPGWIERWGSDDWGVAVQSLAIAGDVTESTTLLDLASRLGEEAVEMTRGGTVFRRFGKTPDEEELPITAASFIEAIGALYLNGRDPAHLAPMRAAVDWFLGANRIGESLYDFGSGGCHDAITASGLNLNQGTEATAFCLLSLLTVHKLAGSAGLDDPGRG